MTFRRFSAVTLGLSLLSVTACSTGNQPQWMPRGYTHQGHNAPISAPQPSSPWSNSAVIHDTNAMGESTAAWQGAVFELLEKLTPALPQDGTPLLLVANPPYTQYDLALDHYLRQALMQKGMNLTGTAGSAMITHFDAAPLSQSNLKTAKTKAGYQSVDNEHLNGLYLLSAVIKSADGKTVIGEAYNVAILPYEKDKASLGLHRSGNHGNLAGGYNP